MPTSTVASSSEASATNPLTQNALDRIRQDSAERHCEEQIAASIGNLSLDDVSGETRVAVAFMGLSVRLIDGGPGLLASSGILMMPQTCKDPWFALTFEQEPCWFYYDPESDDILILNKGKKEIRVRPVSSEIGEGLKGITMLKPHQSSVISPGRWRIGLARSKIFTDFLLFPRRYTLEKQAADSTTLGQKRKTGALVENGPLSTQLNQVRHDMAYP